MKLGTSLTECTDMRWDGIRYFLALREFKTLADCAEALNVSDATVLRQINALEKCLGATLFVRTRKGHDLTLAGERLAAKATKMAEIANELKHVVDGVDDELAGSVTIATTEFGANYLVGPTLLEFTDKFPQIKISVCVTHEHEDLTHHEPWIALRFTRPKKGPYRVQKIGDMEWGFYASSTLLGTSAESNPHTLSGDEPYISWSPPLDSITISTVLEQTFTQGISQVALSTLHGHVNAARSGIGVAHLPCVIADTDPVLHKLQQPGNSCSLEAWIVQPQQFSHLARVQTVIQFVKDSIEKQ